MRNMGPEQLADALLTPSGLFDAGYRTQNPPKPEPLADLIERFRTKQKQVDELMVRTLVEVVNRSPNSLPTPEWARRLGVPLPKFVAICHEEEEPTDEFRRNVAKLFDWLRSGGKPW